ncbi:MAG: tRNA pseudouridine(38-40) synthase TruA [Anaeroplasmataceae bacterium]
MYRVKCIISYDGSNYMGFQVQDNLPTIELRLIEALKKLTGEDIKIYGSGRTDKGVHAKGQVLHFDTSISIPPIGWVKGINSYLPDDIRVLEAFIVDNSFHARFSAIKKEYRYYIKTSGYDVFSRNYYAFYSNLDIELMKKGLEKLVGSHNFEGFCSASVDKRKDFNKTIYKAELKVVDDVIEVIFEGDGFLKYQIRRMMGLIIDIGLHRDTLDKIDLVFETKDPSLSHKKASASGLYLYKVTY